MVDTSLYATFLVAAFVLCITPGPDMMFIVAMGGRGGPTVGVTAAFGVACAMFVHSVAAALGLSALFLTLPVLYHVLRWAGAVYLLHLAVKAFRSGRWRSRRRTGGKGSGSVGGGPFFRGPSPIDGSVGLLSGKLAVRLVASPK
jgi:threonine/homoserine/homoserine lactone efflux protein